VLGLGLGVRVGVRVGIRVRVGLGLRKNRVTERIRRVRVRNNLWPTDDNR
jgi:hypothetical protein